MPELITLAAAMLAAFFLGAWVARRTEQNLPLLPEAVQVHKIRRMRRDEEEIGD
jgi:hypothetical protein